MRCAQIIFSDSTPRTVEIMKILKITAIAVLTAAAVMAAVMAVHAATGNRGEFTTDYASLDGSNGFDVYVWQMARGSYSFALMEHAEPALDWNELLWAHLKGVNVEEMRDILASVGGNAKNVTVIPWQNPYSSYIGEYWIVGDDDTETRRAAYVDRIRDMLFGEIGETMTVVPDGNIVSMHYASAVQNPSSDEEVKPVIRDCTNADSIKFMKLYMNSLHLRDCEEADALSFGGLGFDFQFTYEDGSTVEIRYVHNKYLRTADGKWHELNLFETERFESTVALAGK